MVFSHPSFTSFALQPSFLSGFVSSRLLVTEVKNLVLEIFKILSFLGKRSFQLLV